MTTTSLSTPLDVLYRRHIAGHADRYSLPAGWLRDSGMLALLEPHLVPADHDHPLHRWPDSRSDSPPCSTTPGAHDPATPWHCPHDEPDYRHLHDIGPDLALQMLETAPIGALAQDFSWYSPAPATILRAVARHPGVVTAHAGIWLEERTARIEIDMVTFADDTLYPVTPDVVAAPLPTWIEGLGADDYASYLRDRQACLAHGFERPAWFAAAQRYGIDDARRIPYVSRRDDEAGRQQLVVAW